MFIMQYATLNMTHIQLTIAFDFMQTHRVQYTCHFEADYGPDQHREGENQSYFKFSVTITFLIVLYSYFDILSSPLCFKFEYINLHYHYFGSYHGSGTMDAHGNEGNFGCVKRALELDMGVFQISPFDKGGKVYRPSKDCALLVGQDLTPMEFVALYAWKKAGMHTSSLGIARPSDLDEVMSAARTMATGQKNGVDVDTLLDTTIERLKNHFEEKVGREWAEKVSVY